MSTILHSSNDTLLDAATTSTGMALRDNDIIEESSEDHAKLEDNIEDVQEIDEAIAPERNAVRHRSRFLSILVLKQYLELFFLIFNFIFGLIIKTYFY